MATDDSKRGVIRCGKFFQPVTPGRIQHFLNVRSVKEHAIAQSQVFFCYAVQGGIEFATQLQIGRICPSVWEKSVGYKVVIEVDGANPFQQGLRERRLSGSR